METNTLSRRGRLLCLVLVTVLFLSASTLADEATRWWTWNGFMTEAVFVSTNDDGSVVKLRKVSGKEVDIAVDRLSDEDKRYLQEHHPTSSVPPVPSPEEPTVPFSGEEEGDNFTFCGERLKKSEEISGIRLGDLAKNYVTGKWIREYEIEKEEDAVILTPKNKTSPIRLIIILLDENTQRVDYFSVYMRDASLDNRKAIDKRFSSKYKYEHIASNGDSIYTSKTEPRLIIIVHYDKAEDELRVTYAHIQMIELRRSDKDNSRKGILDSLNL